MVSEIMGDLLQCFYDESDYCGLCEGVEGDWGPRADSLDGVVAGGPHAGARIDDGASYHYGEKNV